MNIADWIIVGILVVSSLISLKRGFIKESLSLVIWFSAFFIAMLFHPNMESLLSEYIPAASLRSMAAFGIIFIAVLLVGSVINGLIAQLVKVTGLTGTDRLLGMIFGFLRGVVLLLATFVFLPNIVPIQEDSWYKESLVIPRILMLEDWSRSASSEVYEWVGSMLATHATEQI